ncbi:MAG: hypothetical protein JSS28_07150 [Proteobacteria bacterium]|nr:hypothetical protein [Pseudomonadota bacterium]
MLGRAREGDARARTQALAQIYERLHALAHRVLAGAPGEHTLDTTSLVHEVYLDLAGDNGLPRAEHRAFFGYAATCMRNLLVDRARRRNASKRGGDVVAVDLDGLDVPAQFDDNELLELDAALAQLQAADPYLANVVELRWFAGLSIDQTASLLERAPRSIDRDWLKARAFLRAAMA